MAKTKAQTPELTGDGYLHRRSDNFGKLPVELMHNKSISDGAKVQYAHMHWRYGSTCKNFEGRASMADMLGVSEATITHRANELEQNDWVIVVPQYNRKGRTTNFYHIFELQSDCREWRKDHNISKPALPAKAKSVKRRNGIGGKPSHKGEETQVHSPSTSTQVHTPPHEVNELEFTTLIQTHEFIQTHDSAQPPSADASGVASFADATPDAPSDPNGTHGRADESRHEEPIVQESIAEPNPHSAPPLPTKRLAPAVPADVLRHLPPTHKVVYSKPDAVILQHVARRGNTWEQGQTLCGITLPSKAYTPEPPEGSAMGVCGLCGDAFAEVAWVEAPLPTAPAGLRHIFTTVKPLTAHFVADTNYPRETLCGVTTMGLANLNRAYAQGYSLCPACQQAADKRTAAKAAKIKPPRKAQPYDVLIDAVATHLFGAKDRASINAVGGRAGKIIHGDKNGVQCIGLIAYECQRQNRERDELDYNQLADDVGLFLKWLRHGYPDIKEVKDCMKVLDYWQKFRNTMKASTGDGKRYNWEKGTWE